MARRKAPARPATDVNHTWTCVSRRAMALAVFGEGSLSKARALTRRGEDDAYLCVIPAKAGIQRKNSLAPQEDNFFVSHWIPAFAGMTSKGRMKANAR